MFLKNKNINFEIKRSKITYYDALNCNVNALIWAKYTRTGRLHTGKCIYCKYVVVAELSKMTYVED